MPNPLYNALLAPAADNPAPFLRDATGDVTSYGAFHDRVAQAANVLVALGLKPGDRLALQVGKSQMALAIYGACLVRGVIFLPLNTAYTPAEIGYFLNDATPALLVCDPGAAPALTPLADRTGTQVLTADATGAGSFADLADAQFTTCPVADRITDDIATLLYTSGTTGRSKGAMLSHGNLLSNAQTLCAEWRIDAIDTLLHALPIFHAHGLFVALNTTLLAGAQMIFLPGFDIDAVLCALPHATTMMGVPTFYTRLLDDPRFDTAACANMRLFVSGSAPLLADTHAAFEARTGHRILERYGMTETSMNTSNPYVGERRAGSVGFPLPGIELRVTDAEAEVPQGGIGMIEVRGPNVFKGYWNMPEKTAEDMRNDGFLITGDLGRIDDDGYVHIVGRNKDLVISGGYNVYPKEVELAIDTAPWVRESAVIGVPHPDFGEAVVAVIVPVDGAAPDLDGLRADLKTRMANYKRPKEMVIVDALPRNTMGKVQKNVLRDSYAGLFTAQATGTG